MNAPATKAPEFQAKSFSCPYCGALAQMVWVHLVERIMFPQSGFKDTPIHYSQCCACNQRGLWVSVRQGTGSLILPSRTSAPMAHPDLPESCRGDYDEAREISTLSPRGAAALLRLCIQKLCKELGQPGKHINDDIGALVKLGLPTAIQKALDVVRVVGNNAVHPGTMSPEDHAAQVETLFKLVNVIVQQMITQPKEIDEMYRSLPEGALNAIGKRDA